MNQRFPEVERIDPFPKPGTLLVNYVVVAQPNQYFKARHRRVVEETLRNRIDNIRTLMVKSGITESRSRLLVAVEPPDSMALNGSFVVHDTLQELFRPAMPFVAVVILRSSIYAEGDFELGIQVLGNPSKETLNQLEVEILAIPHTKAVRRDAKDLQHLIATVSGPLSENLYEYGDALRAHVGIASTLAMNTKHLWAELCH